MKSPHTRFTAWNITLISMICHFPTILSFLHPVLPTIYFQLLPSSSSSSGFMAACETTLKVHTATYCYGMRKE